MFSEVFKGRLHLLMHVFVDSSFIQKVVVKHTLRASNCTHEKPHFGGLGSPFVLQASRTELPCPDASVPSQYWAKIPTSRLLTKIWPLPLIAVWPGASYLDSRGLCFLICKMRRNEGVPAKPQHSAWNAAGCPHMLALRPSSPHLPQPTPHWKPIATPAWMRSLGNWAKILLFK